jgi:hypothetical protein
MFSKLQIVSTLAMLASGLAAIPSDFTCGSTANGFCFACPKGEGVSVSLIPPVKCSCKKAAACTVFTADGELSSIEAYSKSISVPESASVVDEENDDGEDDYEDDAEDDAEDDYDSADETTDDPDELQMDDIDELLAETNAMKEACWDAAPDGVEKNAGIIIDGSKCSAGGKTWSMNEADAAKFDSITSSVTEEVSSSSSSSSTTESTIDSTIESTTTTSAQMAAFAFAPLCVLLAMA